MAAYHVAAGLVVGMFLILSTEYLFTLSFTNSIRPEEHLVKGFHDCYAAPQARPVFANKVEGKSHQFFLSLQDLDANPKTYLNMVAGKFFWKAEICNTMQRVLESMSQGPDRGVVVDVGANIGWATFAATEMGFRVLSFEPVEENVNKLCDGIYLNRVANLVKVFHVAVSDAPGTTTLYKVVGRLDNTAVSEVGATTNIKSDTIAFTVASVTLDSVIPDAVEVALIKVDVQGWEHHVLSGAKNLLSREPSRAPYLIFEHDDKLLKASNTSIGQILDLLRKVGYTSCTDLDGDKHCSKRPDDFSWLGSSVSIHRI